MIRKKKNGSKRKYVLVSTMLLLTLLLTACEKIQNKKETLSQSTENVFEQAPYVNQSKAAREKNTAAVLTLSEKKKSASSKTTSITGHINSTGKGKFVISQIATSKKNDGSDLAVSTDFN